MKGDVRRFVANCTVCDDLRRPIPASRAPLVPIFTGAPFEIVAMDIVGGRDSLPTTPNGNRYILTIIDHFTKWAEAVPLKNMTAKTVALALIDNWVSRHGVPQRILTDQGTNFESALMKTLCKILRVEKSRTTAYKPSTNGGCERFNQTLKNTLVRLVTDHPEKWDQLLPAALLAYRTTVHRATGQTPQFLLYGREIRLPIEAVIGPPSVDHEPNSYASELVRTLDKVAESTRETLGNYRRIM